MTEFLQASLSYPAVLFTGLLSLMLIYWLLVILGAVGLDALGGAEDVDLDLEGVELGASDIDAPSAFSLRRVPLTVALSLIAFFGWLFTHLGSHYLLPLSGLSRGVTGTLLLIVGAVFAYFITRLLTVPLAPLFHTHHATSREDLVGSVITVRTGRVDRDYGQGLLDQDAHALLLEIRCDAGRELHRGQRVMIISIEDDVYEVEPIDDLLGAPSARAGRR